MADDWRRNDRDRFRSEPYRPNPGQSRGSDYEGDGTIAQRGFGNDRSGYEGRGGHVRERDRGYTGSSERDYARHEDHRNTQGAVRYDRPYWGENRNSSPDRAEVPPRRRPEDDGAPGYGDWGSPSLRSRRSDNDSDRGYRSGGHEDRGFWAEAVDEVKSWFGDDDRNSRSAHGRHESGRHESDWDRPSHRGRGPKGHTRSDERIREDVSDRLTDDPHIDASEIEVQVLDREVTLTGMVNSRFEKRHAEDIAESVSGVSHVQNNIRVQQQNLQSGSAGLGTAGMAGLGNTTGSAGVAMAGQGTGGMSSATPGTTGGSSMGLGGTGTGPQGTGLSGTEVGPQGSTSGRGTSGQ